MPARHGSGMASGIGPVPLERGEGARNLAQPQLVDGKCRQGLTGEMIRPYARGDIVQSPGDRQQLSSWRVVKKSPAAFGQDLAAVLVGTVRRDLLQGAARQDDTLVWADLRKRGVLAYGEGQLFR